MSYSLIVIRIRGRIGCTVDAVGNVRAFDCRIRWRLGSRRVGIGVFCGFRIGSMIWFVLVIKGMLVNRKSMVLIMNNYSISSLVLITVNLMII